MGACNFSPALTATLERMMAVARRSRGEKIRMRRERKKRERECVISSCNKSKYNREIFLYTGTKTHLNYMKEAVQGQAHGQIAADLVR
ncbi:hypothetical protein AMTRI_Chr03g45010 [Amborella trichopoda]